MVDDDDDGELLTATCSETDLLEKVSILDTFSCS